ncbi:MAG: LamG domain-containing protein [Myxococcales bacterium]
MGGAAADGCLALHFGDDLATVQIPDLTMPDFGNEGTIELWILPDEGEPGLLVAGGCLFNKWVSFQEDKFFFLNSDASLSVYFAQQVANFTSTPAVVPSKWQHVAFAYDGTSGRIYVDGVKVGEQAGVSAPANSNGNIQIGHVIRDSSLAAMHGFYSELRVSNIARYTASFTPAAHLAADASTTGLWKLDEGAGTVAADASDLDNPGAIDGAEWQLAPCR